MAREAFIGQIRDVVSPMLNRTDFDEKKFVEMLPAYRGWLNARIVENYSPEDFPDLNQSERDALTTAVKEFLQIANDVSDNRPASQERLEAAAKLFGDIVSTIRRLTQEDWQHASNELLGEAEAWMKQDGWPCKRYSKDTTEAFIGNYAQERLVFSAEGSQLALIPVGRFAPGTEGLFDLAVMPAYDSVMVVRRGNRWYIHPTLGDEGRQDWSKEAFESMSLTLARLP